MQTTANKILPFQLLRHFPFTQELSSACAAGDHKSCWCVVKSPQLDLSCSCVCHLPKEVAA